MYTEGGQATGHRRFIQGSCACQRCAQHSGLVYQPASGKQTDHPHLDSWRDIQPPRVKDTGAWGGRAPREDRSLQRPPVFLGPGPLSQSDDLPRLCLPWELNPATCNYLPKADVRHCPSFREQCRCLVKHSHLKAHTVNGGIPHPLPHLRVKGQGCGYGSTAQYNMFVDNREEGCACTPENGHLDQCNPSLGHVLMAKGHWRPKAGPSKGREGSDTNHDSGGSRENCNGHTHKVFFATEVPQKHLNRKKGPSARHPAVNNLEAPALIVTKNQCHGLGLVKQTSEHDVVKDQIRQVVTDLEDVLGGLKQVQVEMKEVIEQIDHLTASIDLGEEPRSITCGLSNNIHASPHRGELRVSPPPKPTLVEGSRRLYEEVIILQTNSPSPIHMASVVKTRCFTPPNHSKDIKHEGPHVNGHLHPLVPHQGPAKHKVDTPDPHSPNLHPEVGNSTAHSRTQKPPLYPQNERSGKTSNPPSKPARTPAYAWRGRQSTSMV
ncbi:uncharacterized protein LOC129170083 [Dunckerocampus dactyliophorus]|uniref:uncharacterized protein LOC129170083 n=1 Tax=Dunckerocampus dactyliophorus TaxID=161453 RepID=UPI0024075AD7|nr:uncharacterized protein LOC129170083 [Dunckerocampus dactyliophorus]XP_054613256.1 uncharacterized protein LOC129170083 [Dunckerocampus dactyliophorus]XP_054613265.1 uncharacterized protein LOC129170083 [Dunckerocampus dactyliophorus]XP_054613276.1 uncharacterized protein LOC129170083 [Dunckerocampus dactyliophorus]